MKIYFDNCSLQRPLDDRTQPRVEYFCTCDDRFLKKAKMLSDLKMKAVSPTELLEQMSK